VGRRTQELAAVWVLVDLDQRDEGKAAAMAYLKRAPVVEDSMDMLSSLGVIAARQRTSEEARQYQMQLLRLDRTGDLLPGSGASS